MILLSGLPLPLFVTRRVLARARLAEFRRIENPYLMRQTIRHDIIDITADSSYIFLVLILSCQEIAHVHT
jgi:hypothetical protein